ncbi:MAG: substrate-binding domain-containing protein [Actinobacteria bacterium]|nr:substrate-binding domain-containing protein [Actinomycetota bacterium]
MILSAATTAAATTAAETTAAPAVEYKIAVYFPSPHPYFESVKKGLAKFTEDFGVEVFKSSNNLYTQDTENIFLEGLVADGYNAILTAGMDPSGTNAIIEEIAAKGIPVINYATTVGDPTPAAFNLATNVKAAAMASTEEVIKGMGEKGGLLDILEYVEDPNTVLRREGVEEVVAKYPDVKIVQTIGDMNAVEESTEKINNALAALGDEVNGMVTTGYNPTVASAQILTEMKNSKISYVGIDDDPIVLETIRNGYMIGSFGQNPYYQGYVGCWLLKQILDGKALKQNSNFIDTYGVIIKKDNIDTFSDELWKAATDAVNGGLDKYFE